MLKCAGGGGNFLKLMKGGGESGWGAGGDHEGDRPHPAPFLGGTVALKQAIENRPVKSLFLMAALPG